MLPAAAHCSQPGQALSWRGDARARGGESVTSGCARPIGLPPLRARSTMARAGDQRTPWSAGSTGRQAVRAGGAGTGAAPDRAPKPSARPPVASPSRLQDGARDRHCGVRAEEQALQLEREEGGGTDRSRARGAGARKRAPPRRAPARAGRCPAHAAMQPPPALQQPASTATATPCRAQLGRVGGRAEPVLPSGFSLLHAATVWPACHSPPPPPRGASARLWLHAHRSCRSSYPPGLHPPLLCRWCMQHPP
jgi:hypothetical protein